MSRLLIVTIITLAVISCLIISLTIISYHFILKSAKRLSASGALDKEFTQEIEENKKPGKKALNWISQIASGIVCVGLVTLAVISGVYHIKGEQFVHNNHVSFVIASDSMESYFSKDYKQDLINAYCLEYGVSEKKASNKIKSDQFEIGDFVELDIVKSSDELRYFDVYGYKAQNGKIITHRLVGTNTDGTLVFRGDNTAGVDYRVKREQVLYHYQGQHTKYVGLVVLFFGSGFGIYSIFAIIGIYVISDIAIYRWEKIKKNRLVELGLCVDEKKKKKNEKA